MNNQLDIAMHIAENYTKAHTTIKNALDAINSLYFISGGFIPDELRLRLKDAEILLNDAYSNSDHHSAVKYIETMNSQIPYEDGKIIWEPNKGFTSKLIKNLYSHGYRASTSGCLHFLYDDKGHKVTQAYSWEGLLLNTAIAMR